MSVPTRKDFEEAFMDMDEDVMRDMFWRLRQFYENTQNEVVESQNVISDALAYLRKDDGNGDVNTDKAQEVLENYLNGE